MSIIFKKNKIKEKIFLFLFLFSIIFFYNIAQADSCTEPGLRGWAWSETIGWTSLSCDPSNPLLGDSDYGVNIQISGENANLVGYAWSENIGWINFDPEGPYLDPGIYPDHSVRVVGNKIIGWARVCSVFQSNCGGALRSNDERAGFSGWILFPDEDYGVKINEADDTIDGFAWGGGGDSIDTAIVGWIDFAEASFDWGMSLIFKIENNENQYCNLIYKDNPFLRVDWRFIQPSFSQEYYQIRVYDESNNIAWQTTDSSGNPSRIQDSTTRAVLVHQDILGNPYFEYGKSYRAEIKVWNHLNRESDWIENQGGYYDMPIHHYPMIDFTWDPEIIELNEEINFIELITYGGSSFINTRLWSFGPDVSPSSTTNQENPTVIFQEVGRRNVSLEITDSSGYKCAKIENIGARYPMPDWKEVSPFGKIKELFKKYFLAFIWNLVA